MALAPPKGPERAGSASSHEKNAVSQLEPLEKNPYKRKLHEAPFYKKVRHLALDN